LGLRSLASGTSAANSLIASLAAPLFDGGALRAQADAQAAAFEQARLDYESAVLVALREVEDALVSLAGDRERVERLQTAAQAAANAELLARQRYQGGLIDFATVLETQRSLLSAQDSLASARVALATDHVQLYKALGGGWLPDAAQP
jgi:outer membrane protein TolC